MVKKSLLWIYRATLIGLWLTIIVLASSVLVLRYLVLPHIEDYKDQIAQRASLAAGQKITIGEINASWDRLNPHLSLFNIEIYDKQNRPALTLNHIESSLSWLSIPLFEPRLSALIIHKPELTVRREADGTVYIAGIAMGGPARPDFPNWLLRQSQIDVLDATVLWQDDMRRAPPLTLNKLNLQIVSPAWESLIGHHRFGLHATPSAGSSQPIDLRGNIYGHDVSQTKNWHGTLYGRLEGTDIVAWRNWVSYPFDLREGFGAAQFWLDFNDGKLEHITSDVMFSNVKTRLSKNSPEAMLNSLSGRLKWTQHTDGQEIHAEHIKATAGGLNMKNGNMGIRTRLIAGKEWTEGNVQLDEIRLETLNTFAPYLPLPVDTLQRLADIAPVGALQKLEMRWKNDPKAANTGALPSEYSLRGRFKGLSIQAYQQVPGFSNLSGSVDADQSTGTLTLDSQQTLLDFKQIMRWPIPAEKLTGQVKWVNSKDKTEVRVSNLAISNAHLEGSINGSYQHNGIKGGYLDLNAKFDHADAKFAHYYYPMILGEKTLHWLDSAILAGRGEDINVVVKGNLHEFPYANGKQGLFKVTAKVSDGVLDYSPGWPRIEGIKLNMLFEGARMELNASAGTILGNQVIKSKVVIPVLHAPHPVVDVVSEGQGPVSEGIKYINSSPLIEHLGAFTQTLRTSGNGKLNLDLHIPLDDIAAIKVKGAYLVNNGSMAGDSFPELTRINGKLEFTESTINAQNVNTWIYGGPAAFNLVTGKDNVIRIAARGRVSDAGLKQAFGPGLADRISGTTDWVGDINVQQPLVEISIRSTLMGMASTLPAPLAKTAGERMPLRIEKKQQTAQQDTINISVANVVGAKLLRTEQNGALQVERGEIGLNVLPEIPAQRGISVRGVVEQLDLDEWRNLFETSTANNAGNRININKVDLAVNVFDVFDRRLNGLKLNAKAVNTGWNISLQSREITGDAQWINQGNGKIIAKLKNLVAPDAAPGTSQLRTQGQFQQQAGQYPALDIVAENFEFRKKKLGRLELQASEQNEDWSIEKLRIINPDSTLTAEGEWHNWKRSPNTRLNLNWHISNLGQTLERFGYPATVKGGEGDLTGQLKWPGSPHEFDVLGLSGTLLLDVHHGQILKLKPGVGRLFSVLSLQNLPRRLTFDFRDVFSSGFTFDKISSNVKIDRGVMRSDDFKMEGPTARIEMRGETDLQKETQHLFINVTPYISDSLSIAALAGGPVVGAAAFIAQKLLKDPINKLAADEYEIVGTWDNPLEVKPENQPTSPSSTPLGK
jgi:uncharacterized protein (TIGR02099 family)